VRPADRSARALTDDDVNLSVVIPTLNAAATLPATLAAIGPGPEIVIADGGSTDATAAVATPARVITAPRGRGSQLAAGIAAASHDWLLLLHADTTLSPGWQGVAEAHIANGPPAAGYFRFRLDSADPRARRLERLVAWRCRVLALPYGDQGLLIHRDLLARAGGMRTLPLMEDVDLVRRLGRGCITGLPADAITSAAKWERHGWTRRSVHNLCCLALWFAGVPPRLIQRLYG
jgi:rSAM/selenodomain-associated transferase 2